MGGALTAAGTKRCSSAARTMRRSCVSRRPWLAERDLRSARPTVRARRAGVTSPDSPAIRSATMKTEEIVLAWKDADYAASLGCDERIALPPNPAGTVEARGEAMEDLA